MCRRILWYGISSRLLHPAHQSKTEDAGKAAHPPPGCHLAISRIHQLGRGQTATMSEISSQNAAIPARAAEWIGNVLRDAGVPASGALLLAMVDHSDLDLRLLNGMCLEILSTPHKCMLSSLMINLSLLSRFSPGPTW